MARQSPDRPDTNELGDESLWEDVRVHPVEIALPTGVGYTLRAYRPAREIRYSAAERRADEVIDGEQDVDEDRAVDEDEAMEFDEADDVRDDDADEADAPDEPDFDDESDAGDEEVPVFLAHEGRLYLCRTKESLVAFVRSGAPHDLTQLDTWAELAERIDQAQVTPDDEDSYELDLVVENLRGGHDVWDPELIISAGEIARDLAYALRIEPLLTALAPGSPLDDLDEALRASLSGGLRGFAGRRRARKIGAQQATLAWRSMIGKISSVVDWRD